MSLVNYSSDEEEGEEEEQQQRIGAVQPASSSSASAFPSSSLFATMKAPKQEIDLLSSKSNIGETSLKLPDASQLLASFGSVKDSMATNFPVGAPASRKRSDVNGSANTPHRKIPKGSLPPSRVSPDTGGGSLLPPQLSGRSNVATEDLDKLFTRKRKTN